MRRLQGKVDEIRQPQRQDGGRECPEGKWSPEVLVQEQPQVRHINGRFIGFDVRNRRKAHSAAGEDLLPEAICFDEQDNDVDGQRAAEEIAHCVAVLVDLRFVVELGHGRAEAPCLPVDRVGDCGG